MAEINHAIAAEIRSIIACVTETLVDIFIVTWLWFF